MAAKTKLVAMTVKVRVPKWMTAAQARREVRSLINDQCGWLDSGPDFEEVTVRAVRVSAERGAG